MRKMLLSMVMVLACTLAARAQMDRRYWSTHEFPGSNVPDSVRNLPLYKAGTFQKRSADFHLAALAFAGASATSFILSIDKDHHEGYNAVGIATAALSVASEVTAIVFRTKSGDKLRIAATGVRLTF